MDKSESIGDLATALSKAQAGMMGAKQDSTNPFYKCKYADLSSVWDACRKPLTDNGLSVTQTMDIGLNGECIIVTTLLHSSGQWISGHLQMPVEPDPQKLGKEITYGRRYALASIAGVSPEDDDAESVVRKPQTKEPAKTTQTKVETSIVEPKPIGDKCTEAQRRKIFASSNAMGYNDQQIKDLVVTKLGIANTKDLTKKQASDLIESIEKGEGLDSETGE